MIAVVDLGRFVSVFRAPNGYRPLAGFVGLGPAEAISIKLKFPTELSAPKELVKQKRAMKKTVDVWSKTVCIYGYSKGNSWELDTYKRVW